MDKKAGTFVLIKRIGELVTGVKVENGNLEKVLREITNPLIHDSCLPAGRHNS